MPADQDYETADLIDAIARGRLCLAELAGVHPDELEALFEAACVHMETHRFADAAVLLLGLITLFPYAAKYWRALGVAEQNSGNPTQAAAAYRAVLVLDPGDMHAHCHLGEVLLDETIGEARAHLDLVARGPDAAVAERARALLAHLAPSTPANAPTYDRQPMESLTVADGRILPLQDGVFAQPSNQPVGALSGSDRILVTTEEPTDTAVVARLAGPHPPLRRDPAHAARSHHSAIPTAMRRRRGGPPLTEDITLVDVKRP